MNTSRDIIHDGREGVYISIVVATQNRLLHSSMVLHLDGLWSSLRCEAPFRLGLDSVCSDLALISPPYEVIRLGVWQIYNQPQLPRSLFTDTGLENDQVGP